MAQAHGRRGQRDPGRERFWREVLTRFRASGLSVRAFCRREKLGEPLFYAWRRTIAERDGGSATNRPAARRATAKGDRATLRKPSGVRKPAPFLPVVMTDEHPVPGAAITIELHGGRVLRFGESLSAGRVADIVRALEALEAAS